jgi:glutathione S-transferase
MGKQLTLVIGNKNYSSWSMRPWCVLTHFKIPFKEILIPLRQPDSKEKLMKYSPSGKVPVLLHDKITVWESLAICEYIADLYPKKNLWPKNKQARAVARAVSCEMHAGFIKLRKNCPVDVRNSKPMDVIPPEVQADITRITKIWEDCRKRYGKGGDFLFGSFSIADAMFAPVVWRFRTYGVKLSGVAEQYYQSMLALPVMNTWLTAAIKEPYKIEHH